MTMCAIVYFLFINCLNQNVASGLILNLRLAENCLGEIIKNNKKQKTTTTKQTNNTHIKKTTKTKLPPPLKKHNKTLPTEQLSMRLLLQEGFYIRSVTLPSIRPSGHICQ